MIKSITFKSRKNKKSRFETVLIITEHGLRMIDTAYDGAKNTDAFIEYVTSHHCHRNDLLVEISVQPTLRGKMKSKTDFRFTDLPALSSFADELEKRYNLLTGQEKNVLKLILRNHKQQSICKTLNISLNTEKGYRKAVHEKTHIGDFSTISEIERILLLKFTHEK